jgi:hypothetical protein
MILLISLELWKTSHQVTAGGYSQSKCIGSQIPDPLPNLAYDRSTNDLSSYKSLHHTAHIPKSIDAFFYYSRPGPKASLHFLILAALIEALCKQDNLICASAQISIGTD